MPQALSKFEQSLSRSVSAPADKVQKKKHIPSKCNSFNYRKKAHKEKLPSVTGKALHQPLVEDEDWEKEIEEFSRRLEKEMKNQMPYDSEEELNTVVNEMTLYDVPRAPSPNQEHYSPSTHHVPPVKWVRCVYSHKLDQFADAEE
ncbi:hypothetical protein AOLI_G00004000 [Acnodon oligacanthus]